jgi:hypothetical protein
MDTPVVQFTGPWDGQVVATSVHAGNAVRADLAAHMVLDDDTRLREEDPHTDRIAEAAPSRMVTSRSRFEVDLNRPRREAVYREPDDCWGLEVWREGRLDQELFEGSLAVYDEVYDALAAKLDEVAARGPFVLLDVHSYNHRRDGADAEPAPVEENPEVNLGTGTVDLDTFGPLVEAFKETLAAQVVQRGTDGEHALDVRENVAFEGRGLAYFVHDRYPGVGCVLALEFKKTWMDEWTAEVDEKHLGELREALAATIPVLEEHLGRVQQG